jgi:uncharacterized protein (TIGR03066 family)
VKTLQLILAAGLAIGLAATAQSGDRGKDAKKDVKVDAAKLLGTWEITYSDAAMGKGSTVEFAKDGKATFNVKGNNVDKTFTAEMDYTVDENTIKFTKKKPKMEETWTVSKFSAKEFETATTTGGTMKFSKKK